MYSIILILFSFADISYMRKFIIFILPVLLFALSPFETSASKNFDLSVFETKKSEENIKATKNPKVKCRYVCDKKIYKEQKMADAISFYKKSKDTK